MKWRSLLRKAWFWGVPHRLLMRWSWRYRSRVIRGRSDRAYALRVKIKEFRRDIGRLYEQGPRRHGVHPDQVDTARLEAWLRDQGSSQDS